jgi:Ca2+-binding RTX toxin-like protein
MTELRSVLSAPITKIVPVVPLEPVDVLKSDMPSAVKTTLSPALFESITDLLPSNHEYWYGTNGPDYKNYNGSKHLHAYGRDGDDFIWGGSKNDYIHGGDGNDTLKGWYGNDHIYGDDGNDKIYGEYGHDYLYGGNGHDYINGGDGNDHMYGNSGNDTMYGADGNDVMDGGFNNDVLYGGNGNDRLNGYGTTINNNSQFDYLYGGDGADTFVLGGSTGVYYNETGDGYAVIKDFDWRENDKIEVKGNASNYQLEYKSVAGIGSAAMDTEVYYLRNDGSRDRIAIVEDKSGGEVLLGLDFKFV